VPERLILTGASQPYGPSLLALLGSLNLNWPDHPPVRVYDIGLGAETLEPLAAAGVDVVRVPAFVPHWRKHFTWKIWAWNEAPARDIFWMDAGSAVLQPMPEVFTALDALGYFLVPTYWSLEVNASLAACEGCGVAPVAREGRMTIAGGTAGFRKEGIVCRVLEEALEVAHTERYIEATQPLHRHDQALLSLLMYKHLGDLVLADGLVYGAFKSPHEVPDQKLWVHRRAMRDQDQAYLAAHIARSAPPHTLSEPQPPQPIRRTPKQHVGLALYKVRERLRGGPHEEPRPGFTVPYDGIRD
jgi:hypothetical protein